MEISFGFFYSLLLWKRFLIINENTKIWALARGITRTKQNQFLNINSLFGSSYATGRPALIFLYCQTIYSHLYRIFWQYKKIACDGTLSSARLSATSNKAVCLHIFLNVNSEPLYCSFCGVIGLGRASYCALKPYLFIIPLNLLWNRSPNDWKELL